MYKVLIWISFVALAILVVKTQYLASDTFVPFKEDCMKLEGATDDRCDCLSRYVHKHFSDLEVKLIREDKLNDPAFKYKVEEVLRLGSQSCAAE